MAWFRRTRPAASAPAVAAPEERAATATQADAAAFFEMLGIQQDEIVVTTRAALSVPAVWAAVNFLSATIAGLPLHIYRRVDDGGRERVRGRLAAILHDAVSPTMSSFAWRKYAMEQVLTGGRSLTFIERDARGEVMNLFPLEASRARLVTEGRDRWYEYRDGGRVIRYGADEVIDVPFMLAEDGLAALGPIASNQDTIALAIAMTRYGKTLFGNGGVPPFVVTGGFQSAGAMQRAADDLQAAVRKASKEKRLALVLPDGLEIKPLGIDPEKAQMQELMRFQNEEIARIYSMPPTFLQDLSHGTFSNTEQQDLQFVKHTVKRWVEQIEQEMNLKLFGRGSEFYVEFSVDGLLRGDYKTRIEGHAVAINSGQITPDEVRAIENRPPLPGGDRLMIQGATVPLVSQSGAAPGPGPSEGERE